MKTMKMNRKRRSFNVKTKFRPSYRLGIRQGTSIEREKMKDSRLFLVWSIILEKNKILSLWPIQIWKEKNWRDLRVWTQVRRGNFSREAYWFDKKEQTKINIYFKYRKFSQGIYFPSNPTIFWSSYLFVFGLQFLIFQHVIMNL